jgi:hypothetical protein
MMNLHRGTERLREGMQHAVRGKTKDKRGGFLKNKINLTLIFYWFNFIHPSDRRT